MMEMALWPQTYDNDSNLLLNIRLDDQKIEQKIDVGIYIGLQ